MRIAITGASGLIGSALRRHLEGQGHTVVPVVRRPAGPGEIGWDPAAGHLDPDDLRGLDGVVHLAGAGIGDKRWNAERKRVLLESRTEGTRLLAEAIAAADDRPPVLVSGSAIGYYGDRGDEILTETSRHGDDFLAGLCVEWEAATAPAEAAGVRVARIRTGIVLSRDGGALPKLLSLFRLGLGGRMGSGRQWMSWIDIDDEVGAIAFLLTHDVQGAVNLTAPDPVTNAQLTKALGAELNRPTILTVPPLGPRLLLGREMADSLLFFSQHIRPAALEAAGYEFAHPLLSGALQHVLAGGTA